MSESKIRKQMIGALQRQLVKRGQQPFSRDFLSLCIMRAREGKLHLTPMDDAEQYILKGDSLDDGLAALAELFSSDRGQMLAVTTLDETFCGVALIVAHSEKWAAHGTTLGGLKRTPVYVGFLVCSLDMSDLIMSYDADLGATEVIDPAGAPELGTAEELDAVTVGVWNVATAIEDSLAAPLPPNHEELTVELLLSSRLTPLVDGSGTASRASLTDGLPQRVSDGGRLAAGLEAVRNRSHS